MSLSEDEVIEYYVTAWIGSDKHTRIFPTPRTKPIIQAALDDFKKQVTNPYFSLFNIPCNFLDIGLQESESSLSSLFVKLRIMKSDSVNLSDKHLVEGSLYLSGEAEIDETLPTDGFTDKDWILRNQLDSIKFDKLYWESKDKSNLFSRIKITLLFH